MKRHLFLEYLLSEKVLRHDKNYEKNKAYVRKKYGDNLTQQQLHGKIETGVSRLYRVLKQNDIKLTQDIETDFEALEQKAAEYGIDVSNADKNWQIHEKDVISGINTLFKTGFFIRQIKDNNIPVATDKYKATLKGGGRLADVRVTNPSNAEFYVECKLNLANAQYFKFGVDINGEQLRYNHKFFLTKNKTSEQLKQIDDLFTQKIKINEFIDEVLNAQETKQHWKQVLQNIKYTIDFIKQEDEFKDLCKNVALNLRFPDCFADIIKIFDTYCEFYISKYNSLIDEIFDEIIDDQMQMLKDTYKIQQRKRTNDVSTGTVFQNVNSIVANIIEREEQLQMKLTKNEEKLIELVKQIKVIEAKFYAMLKGSKLDPYNFNNISQLGKINKLEYFFKMFVSSVGHKDKNKRNPFVDDVTDKLGNLQLCPEYVYDGQKLAQMVTDYYVEKDKCAYIQIADKIFQFKHDWNPLNLPDLPIYSECATKYVVKFAVSPTDLSIRLDIRLMELNESELQNKKIISFKEKDSNYIANVLKNVVIKVD